MITIQLQHLYNFLSNILKKNSTDNHIFLNHIYHHWYIYIKQVLFKDKILFTEHILPTFAGHICILQKQVFNKYVKKKTSSLLSLKKKIKRTKIKAPSKTENVNIKLLGKKYLCCSLCLHVFVFLLENIKVYKGVQGLKSKLANICL